MKLELDIVEEEVKEPYFEGYIVLKVKIVKDNNEKIHMCSNFIRPSKENRTNELMNILSKVIYRIFE